MIQQQVPPIRHLLVVEDNLGRRSILLDADTYSLGRSSGNAIVVHSALVSRQHAMLLRVDKSDSESQRFRIVDGNLLGNRSTNGLFINGQRCLSHDLKHGDVIEFGVEAKAQYLSTVNLSDAEVLAYVQAVSPPTNPVSEFAKTTVIADPALLLQPQSERPELIARLASFPELFPYPILEVDRFGNITYLNPAAVETFPNLQSKGQEHPLLIGLLQVIQEHPHSFCTRQVQVGNTFFEQSIHYLPASNLIRCFAIDITQRLQAERELYLRDRLLQAVTTATHHLLTNSDFETAVPHALATLGAAAEVERVYIYDNRYCLINREPAMQLRFVWQADSFTVHEDNHRQSPAFSSFSLSHWYDHLAEGKTISGLTNSFSPQEQDILNRAGIKSLLIVPILVDDQLWGCIGFDACQSSRCWSKNEEAVLAMMAVSISGAIQRQHKEQVIRYQAFHDLLTDLPNRALFIDRLNLALSNAHRSGEKLSVLFLDLDRFKTINDTLGHSVGDQLLKAVAHRLTHCLREGDTIARWGGDEFTILLPQIHQVNDVAKTAQRMLSALEQPFHLENHELYITPSIGIAIYDLDGHDGETLIKHADMALYQAKQLGRNTYQFFCSGLSNGAPERLNLEKSLRHALERQEFLLYYQPQVNIKTGKITGMEALLRWKHPEMGLVIPQLFMSVAEESGLIVAIGEWVLRTACAQNKTWQDQGLPPICIAVNLSARQFRQPDLTGMIARILDETGLPPQYLDLEITETTAIQDIEFTKRVLQELQDMGIQISMDDFGTGYSSLAHLQQFPLNTLKIDRSFVRDVAANSRDAQIVTAVIGLARGLNLNVVAEGVENDEQLNCLESLHCEEAQGYIFNRPLEADAATEILQLNSFQLQKLQRHE
uniref:Diguanylate cyclase/phosphodiesterase with FHA and GAF sensor n=1 Tax=Cyanothece sp. (strain PCC 7425 / ATCC 29141) TaxID=395961 RepID=B8HWB1_CYAP4